MKKMEYSKKLIVEIKGFFPENQDIQNAVKNSHTNLGLLVLNTMGNNPSENLMSLYQKIHDEDMMYGNNFLKKNEELLKN